MNPMPCFHLEGPREREGLHERETAGIVVKTGWGAGLMVRRTYFTRPMGKSRFSIGGEAYWVWCEASHRWRLCEPAGMFTAHAGDTP